MKFTSVLFFGLILFMLSCNTKKEIKQNDKPNVIIIYADDWGYGDLSLHGSPYLKTPNIDQLASEGIDFQQFNVTNPVCSPSRASLMTGRFPSEISFHLALGNPFNNINRGIPDWLDPQLFNIPRAFQQAGYTTGHFGKWHLTSINNPEAHLATGAPDAPTMDAYGYDESRVFQGPRSYKGDGVKLTATATNAVKFIKKHADQPFFLNVWLHQTHIPHLPSKASMDAWSHLSKEEQVYAAVVSDGDKAVGEIMDTLKALDIDKNTLVIFASDNGPAPLYEDNDKFSAMYDYGYEEGESIGYEYGYGQKYNLGSTNDMRGGKRSLLEGGVRVPFIVRWPNAVPAGKVDDTSVIIAADLLPTLCAAAHIDIPKDVEIDGENRLSVLKGASVKRTKPIFWRWTGDPKIFWKNKKGDPRGVPQETWPRLAIREGDWKLVIGPKETSPPQLYNIPLDRAEQNDVAAKHPQKVEQLKQQLLEWRAALPTEVDPRLFSSRRKELKE